jgi:hypothetical protein
MRRISLSGQLCILLTLALFLLIPFSAIAGHPEETGHGTPEHAPPEEVVPFDRPVEEIVEFLGPGTELEIFPCSECHDEDWEPNPERRDLDEPHDEIPGIFANHDTDNRWCLDCHSEKNRDKLILLIRELIDFKEYYRLCAQCHKRIFREWKMGVHGKRTGYWDGVAEYTQCTQCHNPHNPPFKPIKPMPAPRKPGDIKVMSGNK